MTGIMTTMMMMMMIIVITMMIRFAVELDEKEMTGNKKFSDEQLFKTAGETKVMMVLMMRMMRVMMKITSMTIKLQNVQVVRLSASDFTVGYHWDPVRQVKTLYIKIRHHHHHRHRHHCHQHRRHHHHNNDQVSDLRLASISFPRSAIEHASCLDYIQVP